MDLVIFGDTHELHRGVETPGVTSSYALATSQCSAGVYLRLRTSTIGSASCNIRIRLWCPSITNSLWRQTPKRRSPLSKGYGPERLGGHDLGAPHLRLPVTPFYGVAFGNASAQNRGSSLGSYGGIPTHRYARSSLQHSGHSSGTSQCVEARSCCTG